MFMNSFELKYSRRKTLTRRDDCTSSTSCFILIHIIFKNRSVIKIYISLVCNVNTLCGDCCVSFLPLFVCASKITRVHFVSSCAEKSSDLAAVDAVIRKTIVISWFEPYESQLILSRDLPIEWDLKDFSLYHEGAFRLVGTWGVVTAWKHRRFNKSRRPMSVLSYSCFDSVYMF